jgi:vacuolar protein sorting-associated protein 45
MSLTTSARSYITRALSPPGMKCLLVDVSSAAMIGLIISQSQIIAENVYLTERIDKDTSPHNVANQAAKIDHMHHLKAIVFIRPVIRSINSLKRLIQSKRFIHITVHFTAMVSDTDLQSIAEVDADNVVEGVHELYLDYYAIMPHVCHLAERATKRMMVQERSAYQQQARAVYKRHVDGLVSLVLALRRRCDVRFTSGSPICRFLGNELHRQQQLDRELFDFGASSNQANNLVLLLDRRDDPVTPLLTQWTYAAMCHEIIGADNNRVMLPNGQELVLSTETDHFYKGSAWLNFGDLGASIKDLVSDYQRKTSNHAKLDSIEAMQRFVDRFPEFRALSGTVSKHVAVVSELSKAVNERNLMAVSEVEQHLACQDDIRTADDLVEKLFKDNKIQFQDALRVGMLYRLRYESNPDSQHLKWRSLLRDKLNQSNKSSINQSNKTTLNHLNSEQLKLIDDLIDYAGENKRSIKLFESNKSLFARASQLLTSGIRGVENIYTQHKPPFINIINQLISVNSQSTLPTMAELAESFPSPNEAPITAAYKFIIVFIVGGATFEEAAAVEALNKSATGVKIILAGSTIHNSQSFIEDFSTKVTSDQHTMEIMDAAPERSKR